MGVQEVPTDCNTSKQFTLWDLGCTHSINSYFKLYTDYKPLYPADDIEVNSIGGLMKTHGVGTIILDLEDNTGKTRNINFENVYYFPGAPKLLVSPHKWARGIWEAKVGG